MNGNKLLVDTNILVYLYEGNPAVVELLNGKTLFISFITEIELFSKAGLKAAEKRTLKNLMNDLIIIDVNQNIKDRTVIIRQETKVKIPDAIIAATANTLSIPLVTSDKGFKKILDLNILLLPV